MDRERIQRYRAALEYRRLTEKLHALDRIDPAMELVWSALHEGTAASDISLTNDPIVAQSAADLLVIVADVEVVQLGEVAGYYPEGFTEVIRQLSEWRHPSQPALAELLNSTNARAFGSRRMKKPQAFDDAIDEEAIFVALQADWSDLATPPRRSCIRLLIFSSERIWKRAYDRVASLQEAFQNDPNLHLSSTDVDAVSWALSGREDLYNEPDWTQLHVFGSPAVRRAMRSAKAEARSSELSQVLGRFDQPGLPPRPRGSYPLSAPQSEGLTDPGEGVST